MGSPSTPLGNVEVVATSLYVADLDRAVVWYEENLGWRPTIEGVDGDRYATYILAGTLIVLEPLAAALEPGEPGRESSTINLLVSRDPRQVRDELMQRGVACSELVQSNFLSFLIRDADGNRFYVSRATSEEGQHAVYDVAKGPSPLS